MKRFTESWLLSWIFFLVIGAAVTYLMTTAYRWGGLSFAAIAFLIPAAVTWFVLPEGRTHRWWRWLVVAFIATQTAYPFTAIASTVAIGWLLHQLYVVEFGPQDTTAASPAKSAPRPPRTPKDHERKSRTRGPSKGQPEAKEAARPKQPKGIRPQ